MSGAVAMGLNIGAFMWLRTIMSFQQVHGTRMTTSIRILYRQGGIRRFYQGFMPALIQGPVARFGDTASNTGVLLLLDSRAETRDLPIAVKTLTGSLVSSFWRLVLMPLDNLLIHKQVEGRQGWKSLVHKVYDEGPCVLYRGASAAFAAQLLGHFTWFGVYNALQSQIPHHPCHSSSMGGELGRSALIGFLATLVSDCLSNGFVVVKCVKQASREVLTYQEATRDIMQVDGFRGLMGRGLSVRLMASGVQGMTFAVTWKFLDDCIFREGGDCALWAGALQTWRSTNSSSSHGDKRTSSCG